MNLLIYGVSGYTGLLVLEQAVQRGLRPVIAGRNATKIQNLADNYNLEFRVFELNSVEQIIENLKGIDVVLHLAGPFRDTARPMAEACIAVGCHYLDITGEIEIMQWMKGKSEEAKSGNVMLMCGVGFDLVPTDCVAVRLKEMMPDADRLIIAFYMKDGGISHGTVATMIGQLGQTGYTRKHGSLSPEPLGKHGKVFSFGKHRKFCISIPWGDVFSAYESTGIPNIETYTHVSKAVYYLLKFQKIFNPLLRKTWLQKFMLKWVNNNITGPTPSQNQNGQSYVHGIAFDKQGNQTDYSLKGPESYRLTALSAVMIVEKVMAGKFKPGYQTPAQVYGANLALEIPGMTELQSLK